MYRSSDPHVNNPKTFKEIPAWIPFSSLPLWSEPRDGARPSTGVPYRRTTVYIFNAAWILHAPRIGARNLFDAACLPLKTVSPGSCPRRGDCGLLWVDWPMYLKNYRIGANYFENLNTWILIMYIYNIVWKKRINYIWCFTQERELRNNCFNIKNVKKISHKISKKPIFIKNFYS